MLDRKYGVGINSRDLRGPHIMNITGVRLSKQSSHQPETDAGYEPVFPSKEPASKNMQVSLYITTKIKVSGTCAF